MGSGSKGEQSIDAQRNPPGNIPQSKSIDVTGIKGYEITSDTSVL